MPGKIDWIQLLILLIVFGGGIIRFIVQSLTSGKEVPDQGKPIARPKSPAVEILEKLRENEEAIALLSPLVKIYPDIEDYILLNLAKAELLNKMHEKARAHALQLIKKFPDTQFYPEAQIILANTYIPNKWN